MHCRRDLFPGVNSRKSGNLSQHVVTERENFQLTVLQKRRYVFPAGGADCIVIHSQCAEVLAIAQGAKNAGETPCPDAVEC